MKTTISAGLLAAAIAIFGVTLGAEGSTTAADLNGEKGVAIGARIATAKRSTS